MRYLIMVVAVACSVLAFRSPGAADEPLKKSPPTEAKITSSRLTPEKYEQIKVGMTVKELTDLFGSVSRLRTVTSQLPQYEGAITTLEWEDASRIQVKLRSGKVEEVSGSVSATLAFGSFTQDNVLKLLPGMTEEEVVKLLGTTFFVAKHKDQPAETKVLVWSPYFHITVDIFQGKVTSGRGMGSRSPQSWEGLR